MSLSWPSWSESCGRWPCGQPISGIGAFRKSLDARDKSDIAYVYSLEVGLAEHEPQCVERTRRKRGGVEVDLYREVPFEMPAPGSSRWTTGP